MDNNLVKVSPELKASIQRLHTVRVGDVVEHKGKPCSGWTLDSGCIWGYAPDGEAIFNLRIWVPEELPENEVREHERDMLAAEAVNSFPLKPDYTHVLVKPGRTLFCWRVDGRYIQGRGPYQWCVRDTDTEYTVMSPEEYAMRKAREEEAENRNRITERANALTDLSYEIYEVDGVSYGRKDGFVACIVEYGDGDWWVEEIPIIP